MLGENHSLLNDFPEYSEIIATLTKENKTFAIKANQHHELDTEIRELELSNSPIDDHTMHEKNRYVRPLKTNCIA